MPTTGSVKVTAWEMASEQLNHPKVCPICGRNSIKAFERPGALDLYQCEDGHFFLSDTARRQVVDERKNPAVSHGGVNAAHRCTVAERSTKVC